MGITGISFIIEMDGPLKDIPLNQIEPLEIQFEELDGKTNTIFFSSFDVTKDAKGRRFIFDAFDPTDIDDFPIEDYPTVSDFMDKKITSFRLRCGNDSDIDFSVLPVAIHNLELYDNYRHEMSDDVCKKLTNALIVSTSRDPTAENSYICQEIDGERKWVPVVSQKEQETGMTKGDAINELERVGIWDWDDYEEYKINWYRIRPGFTENIGAVYFGNNMYTIEALKREDGKQVVSVDLYRPKNLQIPANEQIYEFDFPENDISELVDNHLSEKATANVTVITDPEDFKNYDKLQEAITTALYNVGLIDEKNISLYEEMRKNRSGFYQQFERKYDTLENISLHRLSFPKELVNQTKLTTDEVKELGSYYFDLAKLTAVPGQSMIERNRETVIEMIKDGFSEYRIGTIFLDINRRMALGPRNNGVPSILKEPQIKAMLEAQNAVKTRSFER